MLRALLLNRFTALAVAVGVVVLVWNVVVWLNDDGRVAGRVVDPAGKAVAGAEVTVKSNELDNLGAPPITAMSGPDGHFVAEGVPFFDFTIAARHGDARTEAPVPYHLYFRGQNFALPEPLVLRPSP